MLTWYAIKSDDNLRERSLSSKGKNHFPFLWIEYIIIYRIWHLRQYIKKVKFTSVEKKYTFYSKSLQQLLETFIVRWKHFNLADSYLSRNLSERYGCYCCPVTCNKVFNKPDQRFSTGVPRNPWVPWKALEVPPVYELDVYLLINCSYGCLQIVF